MPLKIKQEYVSYIYLPLKFPKLNETEWKSMECEQRGARNLQASKPLMQVT